jgi:hypothetical protein
MVGTPKTAAKVAACVSVIATFSDAGVVLAP